MRKNDKVFSFTALLCQKASELVSLVSEVINGERTLSISFKDSKRKPKK